MKDAARIRLEPADILWPVARENAKARAACWVVGHDWLVLREVKRIKRQGKVHDDSVGIGDSKVVHHFGRANTRNRSVDQIAWGHGAAFVSRIVC